MKIIITGHTSGVGKALYDHFSKGHEVIGISRATGYNLLTDVDKIVKLSQGCDLFINNTYANEVQLDLLEKLNDKVGMMIVMGSIAGQYHQLLQSEYSKNKLALAERCRALSTIPGNKILHLQISMLEDAVSSDNLISYQEVVDTVTYWISHPRITAINFEFKLTEFTLERIKETFGATQESIDYILNNMCNLNKQHFNDNS
jgi:hypothetical protein